MVSIYIVLSVVTIFSFFTEILGSEDTKILDQMMDNRMEKPTLPPQPSVCTSYANITDSWRHIDYVNRGEFPTYCDKTGSDSSYTNLAWGSWFRFTGAAGTKLPTAPAPVGGGPTVDKRICGTDGVAWISGDNPTIQDGIVTRNVCLEYGRWGCESRTTVGVAACRDIHGDYFVYQLQPTPGCNYAYCAID